MALYLIKKYIQIFAYFNFANFNAMYKWKFKYRPSLTHTCIFKTHIFCKISYAPFLLQNFKIKNLIPNFEIQSALKNSKKQNLNFIKLSCIDSMNIL